MSKRRLSMENRGNSEPCDELEDVRDPHLEDEDEFVAEPCEFDEVLC